MKDKNMRSIIGAVVSVVLLAVITVVAAGVASAQTAHRKKSKAAKTTPVLEAESAGQQAAVDPETGQLRQPTREEAQQLSEEMKKKYSRTPEKLSATQQSDGTLIVELGEEYMDVMVVKIDSDGKVVTDCVRGKTNAEAVVKAASQPTEEVSQSQSSKPTVSGSESAKPVQPTSAKGGHNFGKIRHGSPEKGVRP